MICLLRRQHVESNLSSLTNPHVSNGSQKGEIVSAAKSVSDSVSVMSFFTMVFGKRFPNLFDVFRLRTCDSSTVLRSRVERCVGSSHKLVNK